MSDDDPVMDSLSRAIADFRDEVLLRIDTALKRLRERDQQESQSVDGRLFTTRFARPVMDVVQSSVETSAGPQSSSLDSLERLDALARLLDQRLMATREEISTGSGASEETGRSNASSNERPRGGEP